MADSSKRGIDCDDCGDDGERGERGKRGKRGPRGHHGRDGHDGLTGPTGPQGPGSTGPAEAIGLNFVYRPDATGEDAPGGNVYTDWFELMAAVDATSKLGERTIEFDSRFSTAPSGVAVIPPGTFNMTNTVWVSTGDTETAILLADGVLFTVDPPGPNGDVNIMRFEGPFMTIVGNRTAGPAPFTDIGILARGLVTRFIQNPALGSAALPMFAVTPAAGSITLAFDTGRGGLGQFPVSLFLPPGPPIIDTGTDIVELRANAGLFANDIVTGAGFFDIGLFSGIAWGDVFSEFSNPSFTGVYGQTVGVYMVRHLSFGIIDANITGGLPWDGFYNELILVDPSKGPVTINLPNAASPVTGERVTVKAIGDIDESNVITITSAFGNTIEQPVIDNSNGSKTWSMSGDGTWYLTAVV
jgi:hypothetical protein